MQIGLPQQPFLLTGLTVFSIENRYSGILATDLFSLNTLLGSMIESKVVQYSSTRIVISGMMANVMPINVEKMN